MVTVRLPRDVGGRRDTVAREARGTAGEASAGGTYTAREPVDKTFSTGGAERPQRSTLVGYGVSGAVVFDPPGPHPYRVGRLCAGFPAAHPCFRTVEPSS